MIRSKIGSILVIVLVALVGMMVLGQFLGVPMGLGYVETGSMEPALNAGDGFVALPPMLAGEISQGDVITFDAQELHGGGLVTHRVAEVTDEGYITRGDANPFTDQDGDEPVVRDAQVVSVALHFGDDPIRIPYLGLILMGIQGATAGLIGGLTGLPVIGNVFGAGVGGTFMMLGIAIITLSYLWDNTKGNERKSGRSRNRENYVQFSVILLVILALVLVPLTASMIIPSGTQDTTIISSNSPSEDPTVIEAGGSSEIEYEISNNGFIPRIVMLEPASEGVTITEQRLAVYHGEVAGSTATLHAPAETGAYQRSISERHYPMVLPISVITTLHGIHPWVAIIMINLFVAVVITAIVVAVLGTHPLRLRSTSRDIPLSTKLKQYLR